MSPPNEAVPVRCWPVAEWPAQDQAAWTEALRPGDLLDKGGVAERWAAVPVAMVANGYGRWLAWLADNRLFGAAESPEQRVSRERVFAYAAHLKATTAPFSVASRIQQLGDAMRALAPHGDWYWILRGAGRIRAQASSIRDKLARLQRSDRLVELGLRIMAEADAATAGRAARRAADYRDGLIIALLAHRPLRARNVAMIECGRHLVRRADGWWLAFTAEETKPEQPIDAPFPAHLAANLEHYLSVHRPTLLEVGQRHGRPGTPALWVSGFGRAMCYANIGIQVRQHTKAAFGRAISPHLFRDCAATSIATAVPEEVELILPVLGHSTLATSERHYNQAQTLEAGRRYQDVIDELQRRVGADARKRARARLVKEPS